MEERNTLFKYISGDICRIKDDATVAKYNEFISDSDRIPKTWLISDEQLDAIRGVDLIIESRLIGQVVSSEQYILTKHNVDDNFRIRLIGALIDLQEVDHVISGQAISERSKTLWKKSSTGALMQWNIVRMDHTYWTEYGQVGGKIQVDVPTVCVGKSIGKPSEKTPEQQAIAEVKSKIKKQMKIKNYVDDIDDVDKFIFTTMLAQTYDKHHKKLPHNIMVSPKLDGVRSYTTKDGAYSRNGIQWVASRYIEQAMIPFFDRYPNIVVDGELYCHRLHDDFNKIISLAKRMKNFTEAKWLDVEMNLEYHVFDIYDPDNPDMTAEDRYNFINREFGSNQCANVICVDTEFCTKDNFHPIFERYMANGYEGIMMRDPSSPYESKRSYFLQKYKEFVDEEFKILDVLEGMGSRAGMMGKILLAKGDVTFESNARGNVKFYTKLLNERSDYIGKMATIRYQNLTPDGIPRFPVCVAIRDYE
jgi:DNA ligase-1